MLELTSLKRYQAKEFSFTFTFIINTLILKINQKNIMQAIKKQMCVSNDQLKNFG